MLHFAPSPTPPWVFPSPTPPGPVFTLVHVDPQSSERQISRFSLPVPSHNLRESKGSMIIAAATVPLTAGLDALPGGVTFCQVPAAGRFSHSLSGPRAV